MTTEAKRKPGEGSIEPLPSGRFRARVVLADGQRHDLGVHDTYEEAEAIIVATLEMASANHMLSVGTGVTLRGWGTRFMDELERSNYIAKPTARSAWKNWISEAPFIDWPIKRITHKAVEKWLKSICVKHVELSDSWFHQLLVLLRKCFHEAVQAELLEVNPIETLRVPQRDARTEEAWTYLTLDEQRALFSCARVPEWWRLTVAVIVGTGMRGGEAWLLHLRDVHLDGATPHITVRYGSRRAGKLKAPKGRKIREVPLLPLARDALRRWLEYLPTWAPRNELGLVFPGQRGGYQKVSRWPGWKGYLKEAGITRRVRPHDLRHTCGSALVSGMWGEPWRLHEVRDFLGHASIEETERYAHLAPDALHRSAAKTVVSFFDPTPVPRDPKLSVIQGAYGSIGVSDGSCSQIERLPAVALPSGIGVGRGLAERLLRAAGAGEDCSALADALASEVLASEPVALARKVLAGGPHSLDRALELARLMVGAPDSAAGEGTNG